MTTPTFLHVPYNALNASNQSSAAIAASCDVTYKLHPVVVMSILDHYKRRQQGQGRVVGTLLGERKGDRVLIKHAFPVPHEEGEDQIKVDMDYHSNMLAMHQKVNPRDTVVGWYSTSDTIGYISALIHGAYRDVVLAANSSIEPVLLTVDVSLTNNRLAIKAYTSSVLKFGGREILARFECAPLELHAYEAEKIGIDALLSGHPDEGCGLDAPALLFTENEALAGAMDELSEAIEICSSYVERVKKGEIDGDPELGESISNALAAIPHVDAQSFSQLFNSHTQDLLMLIYLANLTKTQINIADKVGAVV